MNGSQKTVHAAALIGVAAVLFFHPGAWDMDRIKWHLLLCVALPVLVGAARFKGIRRAAAAPIARGLSGAALLPVFLVVSLFPTLSLDTDGLREIAGLLLLVLLAVTAGTASRGRGLVIPGYLLAAGSLAALYGLLQAAGFDPFYVDNPNREAVSFFGNTNELAEAAALLLPMSFCLLLDPDLRAGIPGAAALTLLTAGLWVSGGRGGVLAAILGVGTFFIVHAWTARRLKPADDPSAKEGPLTDQGARAVTGSKGKRFLLAAGALLLGLLLGLLFGSGRSLALKNIESEASIFSPDYPTNKVRIEIWKSTAKLIKDRPVLGVGAGRFRTAFPPYRSGEEARIRGLLGAVTEVHDPHNEYLWFAAIAGIPAAIVFAAFLFLAIRRAAAAAKEASSPRERLFRCGAAGTALAFGILALFRSPLHNPAAAVILFLILGQAMAPSGERPAFSSRRLALGERLALPALGVLLAASLWIGVPGFASDWLAASVGIADRIKPKEFETLKRAADLDPSNIDINNFVGQIAGGRLAGTAADRDGRYRREAKKRLRGVLARHPYHPGALETLARLRVLEGDFPAALLLMKRCLAVRHETEKPEQVLVEMLEKENRFKEAANLLRPSSRSDPRPLLERAESWFARDKPEIAVIYADHYLSARPLDGDALYLYGRCLKALFDEGEKDAFRRMHLAYCLDWIAEGNFKEASRSIRASQRYGEGGGGGAALLSAIVDALGGGEFTPPAEQRVRNLALIERLQEIAAHGALPKAVADYIAGL